jgi:hypothetical protein
MKKTFVALAMLAVGSSFVSCDKKCSCTFTLPGYTQKITLEEIDPGDKKCKDLTTIEYGGLSYDAKTIGLTCK